LIPYDTLPGVNAALNGLCALLLVCGYACIRRKKIEAHRTFMISAFVVSIVFLASYLVYHAHAGVHRYPGKGLARGAYLSILATHTLLAAAVPVLAIVTLTFALGERFARHRKIARWTLPVWLYVSITGVVVYWMLYH
jgi:uncharacterized membrane protein YozB (DUF420 family)